MFFGFHFFMETKNGSFAIFFCNFEPKYLFVLSQYSSELWTYPNCKIWDIRFLSDFRLIMITTPFLLILALQQTAYNAFPAFTRSYLIVCSKKMEKENKSFSSDLLTRAYTEINLRGQNLNCNSKHLTSWISGISKRYFKGTLTVQLPCKYTALSLFQTKLAEKSIVSKKSHVIILLC